MVSDVLCKKTEVMMRNADGKVKALDTFASALYDETTLSAEKRHASIAAKSVVESSRSA